MRRPERGRVEVRWGRDDDDRRVVLSDAATGRWVPPERRRVGYVPQDGALFPHLSVRDNLLYGYRHDPGAALAQAAPIRRFTLKSAEVLEISPLLKPSERRRLFRGRAPTRRLGPRAAGWPRVLLLDEPLAGLDAGLKERVLSHLVRVRDEFAVPMLYVTHTPAEVLALRDAVLVLARGRVVARGVPAVLFVPARELTYVLRTPRT